MSALHPTKISDLCDLVQQDVHLRAIGGGSKPTLSRPPEKWASVDVSAFAGVMQYEPSEFTITVGAATRLSEIRDCLAANGQFMPFDPPLVNKGATIGGTMAAGLSGSGFFRFGTIRDFVLQVRMVDGLGKLVTGGSKVVKNAAGFDLPKLFVGSLGRLGIMTEVTMKVFPEPAFRRTIEINAPDFRAAVALQNTLARSSLGLEAIDLQPPMTVYVRACGTNESTNQVMSRIELISKEASAHAIDRGDDPQPWQGFQDWTWIEDEDRLVKVPLAPRQIEEIDRLLNEQRVVRRFSGSGNVVWVRWPGPRPIRALDEILNDVGLSGLILTGDVPRVRLGQERSNPFGLRIKQALDPRGIFGSQQ